MRMISKITLFLSDKKILYIKYNVMSRKFISSFSNIFQILCNTVTMKPSSLTVLGQSSSHNHINSVVFGMKRYCTGHDGEIVAETILKKDKISMTEEDKKIIQNWIKICKFDGREVPKSISDEQFMELFKAKTDGSKKNYLNYLVKREAAIEKSKLVKALRTEKHLKLKKERMSRTYDHIEYGLKKNAMFTKINKRDLIDLYHHRLISSMIYGQPLVIDLGFEKHLVKKELAFYAEQLSNAISINRSSNEQFNLIFCNANLESEGFQKLVKHMPSIIKPTFPVSITSQSYLEMFPKKNLVYLSPNAREEMIKFDHNAIYIIGGLVDRDRDLFTLAKAKRDNIKIQKLPLDQYLVFKGSKSLAINVMVSILLDVQKDGNWKKAFRNIPTKLIRNADEDHHNHLKRKPKP